MPTGYTADIESGKITEFKDFALLCARAFGALIALRDEPLSANLPDEIKAETSYYDTALEREEKELTDLEAMTSTEIAAKAEASYQKAMADFLERHAEHEKAQSRYRAMLASVHSWSPPSADHQELKKFMTEQLLTSMGKFWGENPKRQSAEEWHDAALKEARRSIRYHREERAKEIDRAKGRTKWLRQLRASL